MGASSILTVVMTVRIEIVYKGPISVFLFVVCRKEENAGMRWAFKVTVTQCGAGQGCKAVDHPQCRPGLVCTPLLRHPMWLDSGEFMKP
jgi:hypothetical protein